jgi:uncharacterized protein GlcG (DUF336 family)
MLAANPLAPGDGDPAVVAEGESWPNPWHNEDMPGDVNRSNLVTPIDALTVINDINNFGVRLLVASEEVRPLTRFAWVDVNGDGHVTSNDVLHVVNELNAEAEGETSVVIEEADVKALLSRAAAATATEDAIIAIVDRGGRILGVRAEADVLATYAGRTDEFVFAIDGAVSKARTAAFFANGDGDGIVGPLTSRTIRFISQSTITEREVVANPSITDPDATDRGPGFVAPIGLGGHFPPAIAHTPPVDLFAIEHTNRDSLKHAGRDGIIGTFDEGEVDLIKRFGATSLVDGIEAPESYGFESELAPDARSRGIATLPGGIPLYKADVDTGRPILVGGIGVFFPGSDGYATFEQGFVAGIGQTEFDRTNAPKVLEAEWIAFAAACGSAGAGAAVGALDGVECPTGYDLPAGRIDLVGITLEIYGPNPTAARPQPGVTTLLGTGTAAGLGDSGSGADQIIAPGVFCRAGKTVPEGWLVAARDSEVMLPDGITPEITAADVDRIIRQAVDEANLVRAGIRLPIGSRTRMVFSVSDRDGNVLGLFRMPDATVFSIDVAVAKSRNTAYYADDAVVDADRVDDDGDGVSDIPLGAALTNRTFRFLSESRYPDGVEDSLAGAFSILRDLGINPDNAENAGPPLPASVYSSDSTSVLGFDAFNPGRNFRDPDNIKNQNGIVFFPGSAPIYVDGRLVGGFGASGDGVDQDDVVTFAATEGYKTPEALRADQYFVREVRLPYQKFLRNPHG